MKIVVIADIHGRIDRLADAQGDIGDSDLVLLTGDITNFGRRSQAEQILDPIRALAPQLLAVPGNCDYPPVGDLLTDLGINLDRRCETLGGVNFLGVGGSLPGPAPTPNEYSEDELERFLEQALSGADPNAASVLVCHQPPKDTAADEVAPGQHVGSQAVRTFLETHQPLLCLTGHIHEAASLDRIGSTQIVNPGPLPTGRYAVIELGDQGVEAVELRGPGN